MKEVISLINQCLGLLIVINNILILIRVNIILFLLHRSFRLFRTLRAVGPLFPVKVRQKRISTIIILLLLPLLIRCCIRWLRTFPLFLFLLHERFLALYSHLQTPLDLFICHLLLRHTRILEVPLKPRLLRQLSIQLPDLLHLPPHFFLLI